MTSDQGAHCDEISCLCCRFFNSSLLYMYVDCSTTHPWWFPAISNVWLWNMRLLLPSILLLHQPTTISAHQESRPTLRVFCTCLNGFRKPPRCSLFWGSREDFDFRSPHVLSHLRHEFVLCHTAAPHIKAKTYWHQPMEFFGCYTHTVLCKSLYFWCYELVNA